VTVDQTVAALRGAGCRIVAADGHGDTVLHTPDATAALSGNHAWAFGNEAHGLPADLLRIVDVAIRVPVYGRAESLNLAAAAAVCLYESARVAQVAGAAAAGQGGRAPVDERHT
jgi:TrmH family RNA methyltransferase